MSEKNKLMKTLHDLLDRMKGKRATGPRCPSLFCNARGVDSIAEERETVQRGRELSKRKVVLYCRECGHVYRVVRV